jgi:hypothetical protein
MGGCSGKEVRELKIASTERLITKYEINLSAFMELNYNWAMMDSLANLASWFHQEERELRLAAANNCHKMQTRRQPRGTGMVCRHEFLQYARKPSNNFQGLGRWCLWLFYCNPTHTTRIVVAFGTGSGKLTGLRTIYQQQICYMQLHNLKGSPQQLFNKDLLHQCKLWCKSGKKVMLL